MTWPMLILTWVVMSVPLGILVSMLLGIRRELEDIGQELDLTFRRVEETRQDVMEVRLNVQASRGEVAALLTEMERIGGFK